MQAALSGTRAIILLWLVLASDLLATPWVSGMVTSGGIPVLAEVQLANGQSTTCLQDGSYQLERPDTNAIWILAHLPGYETAYELLPAGSADRVLDFVLSPLGSAPLLVQVVDNQLQPVPMARLDLIGTTVDPYFTDPTGFCLLDLPLSTAYTVRAIKLDLGIADSTIAHLGPGNLVLALDHDSPLMPTLPDAYGYRIADSGDPVYGPVHEWNSISTGIPLPESRVLTVPFGFRYYGQDCNRLHVHPSCGYLNPLSTNDSGFLSNAGIPHPDAPNGNIYGMWDRYAEDEGMVRYQYRISTGEFVVQFENMRPVNSTETYTWQIVLRDPTVWPTANRDAEWVIHYPDGATNTSTVGLEDNTGTAGVQYLYNGLLAPRAAPLVPGTSLRLVPGEPVGRIVGVIRRGEDNAPLSNVQIRAGDQVDTSTQNGNYSLLVPECQHTLIFELEGYRTQNIQILSQGWQTVNLDVVMQPQPNTTLSGRITNSEGLAVAGAQVRVSEFPDTLILSDADGQYSLALRDSTGNHLEVYKQGLNEAFRFVTTNGPTVEDFILPQNPQFLPSPANSHGYWAFDHNDLGGVAAGWSSAVGEIPQLSGSDTETYMVWLPFTFRFFGEDFDHITIYRHGFIAPGPQVSNLVNLCNNLPLPSIHPWMHGIFIYHDCFNAGTTGTLHAGYSPGRGGFVVEYNNWASYAIPGGTSFQIVILDPALYPSPTGDTSILFHYADGVNNSCTIGIDEYGGPGGFAYQYNSTFADSSCSPLTAGSTLLITPRSAGVLPCDSTEPVVVEMEMGQQVDPLNLVGPYHVRASIQHPCGILAAVLLCRINDGDWQVASMIRDGYEYHAALPTPFPPGGRVEYKVRATSSGVVPVTGECESDTLQFLPEFPLVAYTFDEGDWQGFAQDSIDSSTEWESVYNPAWGWRMRAAGTGDCRLRSPVLNLVDFDQVVLTFHQKVELGQGYSGFSSSTRLWVNNQLLQAYSSTTTRNFVFDDFVFFDISPWAAGEEHVELVFEVEANHSFFWSLDDITLSAVGNQIPTLRIEYTGRGNRLHLEWLATEVISEYHLYSSPTPEGPWSLLAETTATEYEVPLESGCRFFQVRSVFEPVLHGILTTPEPVK
jgi:hypothetical protein